MKRRDFLAGSAGLAGAALPLIGRGQVLPCPPPTVGVNGGTSATTLCDATSALADWSARSTAPGVVWAHRFNDPATVTKFIVAGDLTLAKKYVRHVAADGILGDGCLEINTPAGEAQSGSWGRPMQAIPGDINRAGVTVGPAATDIVSAFNNWRGGFFAHADYQTRWPGQCIGTDYYLQYRVKFSRNRFNANEPAGKSVMLVTNYQTPAQEIVIKLQTAWGGGYYDMYTSVGTNFNSRLTDPQGADTGAAIQPGGPYARSCVIGEAALGGTSNNCWVWPTEEWVTVLVHVIPGHQNVSTNLADPNNPRDTGIEVWVARAGQKTYTKIWSKLDYIWYYGANYLDGSEMPFGWNWINFTAFTGGNVAVPSVAGYYHRHDQVIFSKQFIACPQV